jgi:hypothetical protein
VGADRRRDRCGGEFFLYGGDEMGAFRKKVSYEWGRILVGDKHRKRKLKGRREPTYD